MPLYDISRPLSVETAVWPGDTPYQVERLLDSAKGDSVTLTRLTLSPHTGTHADAPLHYQNGGGDAASLALLPYLGRAQVVKVGRQQGAILPDDLASPLSAPVERILLKTWVSDLPAQTWPQDFPYPSVALIDWLAEQGALLLGLDSPSVDDLNSKTLEGHRRLRARGMAHLESLALAGVPEGIYELLALPLSLQGACASPVRAILRG